MFAPGEVLWHGVVWCLPSSYTRSYFSVHPIRLNIENLQSPLYLTLQTQLDEPTVHSLRIFTPLRSLAWSDQIPYLYSGLT